MKVVLLTSSVSRSAGGLFDAVKDLYENVGRYLQIVVYSYEDAFSKEDASKWTNVTLKVFSSRNPFQYSVKLRNSILKEEADILHVHGLWRYPHAFINTWKKKTGKPVVVTPHGMLDPYILRNQGRLKRIVGNFLFANKAFQNIDYLQALSQKEFEDIRTYGLKQPVVRIPNGINLPATHTKAQRTDGRKSLLFLARLHPKKGVDLLIEAIEKIKRSEEELLKGWVVDIVGWAQENYDEKLKELVERYQLEDTVVFHGGLFDEQKKEMYQNAEGYILPSHGEGLPMTILEAWAYKLPVLMTPMCNLPEGFDLQAALKIDTTIDSIVSSLLVFFEMSAIERDAMGERGYEMVKEHFTWTSSARKMQSLYEKIVNKQTKAEVIYE